MGLSLVGFYLNQARSCILLHIPQGICNEISKHDEISFLCLISTYMILGSNHRNAVSILVKFLCLGVKNITFHKFWLIYSVVKHFWFYDMDNHWKLKSWKYFHATDIWFNSSLASWLCAEIWPKLILTPADVCEL